MSSFLASYPLLACLVLSCSLARLASLLASLLVGRDGLAICVGSVCDCSGHADVVRMSCGCRAAAGCLLLGSLASRLPLAPLPPTRFAGRGTEGVSSVFAFFGFLPSAALVSVRV